MLGLSQAEIAELFGISSQAYWMKEKGHTPFSDLEKMKFKEMLKNIFPDITIDDIFFS